VIDDDALDGVLLADGLDFGLIGVADRDGVRVAVYDADKVVELLMTRDGMDYDDAREFFDFNIAGAYMGPGTPVFMEALRSA
jgi:hypothetical protein